MIGLDTNVLVRYITQDDSKQAALAGRLIEGLDKASPGYITLVTLVELGWVLESAYKFTRSQLVDVFQTLTAVENLKLTACRWWPAQYGTAATAKRILRIV